MHSKCTNSFNSLRFIHDVNDRVKLGDKAKTIVLNKLTSLYKNKNQKDEIKDKNKNLNIENIEANDKNEGKFRNILFDMSSYFNGILYNYLSILFKINISRLFFRNNFNSVFIKFKILKEPTAFFFSQFMCEHLESGVHIAKVGN